MTCSTPSLKAVRRDSMAVRKKSAGDGGPAAAEIAPLRLDDFLPYRFSIVAERISRVFAARYEEAFGLSVPEWRVMAVLGEHVVQTTQAVIERTEMDRVKVSRAVIRLVDRGLVERSDKPGDQRAHVLRLSRQGVKIYRRIVPLADAMQAELAATLEPRELASLDRLLVKIGDAARTLGETTTG